MEVQFYQNLSPTIKLNKNLNPVGSVRNCDIIGAVDVVNPMIVVQGTVDSSVNYMRVGEPLNRLYFITAIDYSIAGSVFISAHCDVLSTFSSFIENTKLNFVRGAAKIGEIEDGSYPIADTLKVVRYPFTDWNNSFFSNSNEGQRYLLRVADGRGKSYDTLRDLEIGDSIIYKNLGFTLMGTYNGAYLSDPIEVTLPEPAGYYRVADGTHFNVTRQDGELYLAQEYRFSVYSGQVGVSEENYGIEVIND